MATDINKHILIFKQATRAEEVLVLLFQIFTTESTSDAEMSNYCKTRLAKTKNNQWELNSSTVTENKECPDKGSKEDTLLTRFEYTLLGLSAKQTKFKPKNRQEYRVFLLL